MIQYLQNFLSRVCGGLRLNTPKVIHPVFLSRVCGGLRWPEVKNLKFVFLSRVCGGLLLA